MTGFPKAILLSVAVHILLAMCLSLYLNLAPVPDIPRLDLSAVEISFSEEPGTKLEEALQAETVPPEEPPAPVPETPEPDTKLEEALQAETVPPEKPPVPVPETPEPDTKPEEAPQAETVPPEEPPVPEPPVPVPQPPEPETRPEKPAPNQARIDAPPRPLKTIRPDYPEGARKRGEEGDVTLELSINAKGRVDSVAVVASSGFPELDAAAVRAAGKAHFTPARFGRVAIPSAARLTITFKLTGR